MKLVYFLSIVSALLIIYCGKSWTTAPSSTITPETTATPTTTAPPTTTPPPTTTGGSGLNLKGKMITLSWSSGVTFQPPNYINVPTTTAYTTSTRYIRNTTTPPPTTPTPTTRGLSVCLRFLVDSSVQLFTLAPGHSYNTGLSFSLDNPWYTLSWYYRYTQYSVRLNPFIPVWSFVRTQPWTSVCVVLDFYKNVVQVFQGGAMSIRKIAPEGMEWSGEPVLRVSEFDGQVTDVEVWDYPLENTEIFNFMQNYGSSGTVLTWSNIAYQPSGEILMEDTYALGQSQPISSSEREEQPIRDKKERVQRRKNKKMLNERRQRKRQML